jgi:hypothetical protein
MQYSLDGTTWQATVPTGLNAGGYTVSYKVKGSDNYTDSEVATVNATIAKAQLTDVTLAQTELTCNGQEQTVAVSSVKAGEIDVPNTGYTVSYENNTSVGTATVTVTGQGNFAGSKSAEFVILRDMSNVFAAGNGWATYVAAEDLALPEGVTAYTVSAVSITDVTAQAIDYIPAGVGILLNRADVTVTNIKAAAYDGTTTTIESMLVGSATEASVLTANTDFVLYRDEFVLSSVTTCAAGRAYLPAPSDNALTRSLNITIGNTTAIEAVEMSGNGQETMEGWYDLNGRRLQGKPTAKGLYIRHGKKVIVK